MQPALLAYRILPTARIGTDEVRSHVVRVRGWDTWRRTSAQLHETITHIRRFSDSGHVPAELQGFVDDSFRQVISGSNRVIYQVRDGTVFIHIVVDTRRDLRSLLQRIVLRLM